MVRQMDTDETDLHVMFLSRYVLLKERNRLLTMEEEYRYQHELFPNPERIDKVISTILIHCSGRASPSFHFQVEESMRNIMTVVRERDVAYQLLETGKTGEQTPQLRY